jgi:voltage-gated potassium channel
LGIFIDFKSTISSVDGVFGVLGRLRIAGMAFLSVLTIGTIGYYRIGGEGTTILDAFYMTGITISTIGYHEIIPMENHPYGRLFTLFIAFLGFGVVTYFVSNLVALFIEGDIRKTFINRKIKNMIAGLENHFIICGCGRVGKNVAKELYLTQREFVMTDIDESALSEFMPDMKGTPYLEGDCTDDEFLLELGIERAKGIFVVSGNDNTNLVICLSARQLNPDIKIVAVSKEIGLVTKLEKAGADKVITPTYIGGLRMASEMLRPTVTNFLDEMLRSDFNRRLEEITIPEVIDGQPLVNFPMQDLDDTMILAAREENSWHYNPRKDYVMKKGTTLVLLTTPQNRMKLEERLG